MPFDHGLRPSWVDFIITTPVFEFSVHTPAQHSRIVSELANYLAGSLSNATSVRYSSGRRRSRVNASSLWAIVLTELDTGKSPILCRDGRKS